jgi:hypothetical protein
VGEHELELRNPAFEPYRRKIVIQPNDTLSHTAEFTPNPQSQLAPQTPPSPQPQPQILPTPS